MRKNNSSKQIYSINELDWDGARVLKFLERLGANNTRERFHDKENQKEYQHVRGMFKEVVGAIKEEITQFDSRIWEVPLKKVIFRINRDLRYTKDKTPYKRNFGASFAYKGGTQSNYAGYYFHIQPGNQSLVGGGLYYPKKSILDSLRVYLEYEGNKLEEVLADKELKEFFGGLQGRTLKTWPRGYNAETDFLQFIRRKDFYLTHSFSDKEIINGNFYKKTIRGCKILYPFLRILNEPLLLEDVD